MLLFDLLCKLTDYTQISIVKRTTKSQKALNMSNTTLFKGYAKDVPDEYFGLIIASKDDSGIHFNTIDGYVYVLGDL